MYALASIRDLVLESHHIDVIVEGLPFDYAPVITSTKTKFDILGLDEV